MTTPYVRSERDGATAVVTLDSPHNRNALSRRLLAELHGALTGALADDGVRVVVLTGAGPVFCSGADLKEAREAGAGAAAPGMAQVLALLLAAPKPVVARVNGTARAGGLGLLAACDLAVAPDTATFAFSEVRLGLVPAIIAVPCLRRMDRQAARELFLTGAPFDAARAVQVGLLDRSVPAADLDEAVAAWTADLALGAPQALALVKGMLRDLPGPDLAADLDAMTALSRERFASAEAAEGVAALLDRRLPAWAPGAPDR